MLQFQFTDTCGLQYSVDGGVTWIDVPGWSTFAPSCFTGPAGPAGPAGTNGTNGVTPELRWSGCVFQVSYDSGGTWTDVPGFDITTLQGCLGGTPAVPPDVSAPQAACNIANWLAIQILQGSMGSLASSLSTSATTLEAALGLFGLAAAWSGIGAVVFEAAGIFIAAGTAIGETALNTAASDATLRADLTCAIYDAIVADGYVTSANFPTILTNIAAISYATPGIVGLIHDYVSNLGYAGLNAIQSEGALYDGNCDACGTWCYKWGAGFADFCTWTPYNTGVVPTCSGSTWHATNNAGDYQCYVLLTLDPTRTYTFVQISRSAGVDEANDIRFYEGAVGSTVLAHSDTHIWSGTVTGAQTLLLSTSLGSAFDLQSCELQGEGANPYGTDNCS